MQLIGTPLLTVPERKILCDTEILAEAAAPVFLHFE